MRLVTPPTLCEENNETGDPPPPPGAGPVCLPTCQPPPFESLIAGRCLLERRAAPAPTLRPEPPCCCCCCCPGRAPLTRAAAPRPGTAPSTLPCFSCPVRKSRLAGAPGALRGGAPLGDRRAGVCWGEAALPPPCPPAHPQTESRGSPGLRSPPGPFPAPLCQRPEQLHPRRVAVKAPRTQRQTITGGHTQRGTGT